MDTLNSISINKKISRGFTISMLLVLPVVFGIRGTLGLISLVGFSLGMIFVFYHSLISFKTLKKDFSIPYFALGIFIILGSALFDISATLFYSPDFKLEANPIILTLLSFNLPFWAIYLISLLHQVCLLSSLILLWGVFLKNYSQMIKLIPYKNLFTTFKWLSGCGQMTTFSDFMLNRKANYYFLTLFFILIIFVSHVARWYYAMDWLEVVPRSDIIPAFIVLVAVFLSVMKIHSHVKAWHLSARIENRQKEE